MKRMTLFFGLISLVLISSVSAQLEEENFQLLLSYLNSSDTALQKEAIMALGTTKEKRAVPHLIPLLQNKSAEVRTCVCDALKEINDERAEKSLIETLKDPDPKVRWAARDALRDIVRHKKH